MDTMAIKYEEIDNMTAAIETYELKVEEYLNKIREYNIAYENGVYGEAQISTIDGYLDETANQINAIVRHFDEFKNKLSQVKDAYEEKQKSISVSAVEAAPEDEGDLVTVNKME